MTTSKLTMNNALLLLWDSMMPRPYITLPKLKNVVVIQKHCIRLQTSVLKNNQQRLPAIIADQHLQAELMSHFDNKI